MASLISMDTVRDNGESVGLRLEDDIAQFLASDTEYRLRQVITAAVDVMKQANRTTLHTNDIVAASRLLDIDPPLGYQSNQPLRWGEASLGAGQPLFYIEDEEVDFEKIINAPLPKVPRELTVTAHWTAIEGVQPLVPMNPSPAEARMNDLAPKGATTTHALGAVGNSENTTVKPLAKHIIAVELQMFFERVTTAITDPDNDRLRDAAISAIRTESTIHQLLPYFVQYVCERVTHDMKGDLFIMRSMLDICAALLENESLQIEPYVVPLCPPIITCLLAKQIGPDPNSQLSTFPLRDYAASIVGTICRRFGESSHDLKARLARSFLKNFIDNTKPYATHYGSILGLASMGVTDAIKVLILPNVKTFEEFIRDEINGDGPKKGEAQACLNAIVDSLKRLRGDEFELLMDGGKSMDLDEETLKRKLVDKIGLLAANEILKTGDEVLAKILIKERQAKKSVGETEGAVVNIESNSKEEKHNEECLENYPDEDVPQEEPTIGITDRAADSGVQGKEQGSGGELGGTASEADENSETNEVDETSEVNNANEASEINDSDEASEVNKANKANKVNEVNNGNESAVKPVQQAAQASPERSIAPAPVEDNPQQAAVEQVIPEVRRTSSRQRKQRVESMEGVQADTQLTSLVLEAVAPDGVLDGPSSGKRATRATTKRKAAAEECPAAVAPGKRRKGTVTAAPKGGKGKAVAAERVEESPAVVAPAKGRKVAVATAPKGRKGKAAAEAEAEGDPAVAAPTKKRKATAAASSSSKKAKAAPEELGDGDGSVVTAPVRKRRTAAAATPGGRKRKAATEEEEAEGEHAVAAPAKRRKAAVAAGSSSKIKAAKKAEEGPLVAAPGEKRGTAAAAAPSSKKRKAGEGAGSNSEVAAPAKRRKAAVTAAPKKTKAEKATGPGLAQAPLRRSGRLNAAAKM
ncbi:hypothetical protein DRE_00401 [Drechslerella stenobrocha 248]|uniref:TATA box binding protein associated factor (TAF) histone-like fold domain-containing protein n=1 Tax=Drechslerella stenobrocha 248 TaxID=1043628 RepID=W7I5H1_9PEZI|nr:hypothetical protein DRE_00401 [Drechslerella stenobrocha 248]